MAKNDILLVDGIIDSRVEQNRPSKDRGEAFEYLVFEQLTKDFDLSSEEISAGAIDGRGDGGIDGFYIYVNGHIVENLDDFIWPRTNAELRIQIITCKHHDTFRQATLDALIATLTEILDFSIIPKDLKGKYSENIIDKRTTLKESYRKLSPSLSSFMIDVYYASRGDTSSIGDEVSARGLQIQNLMKEYFGSCTSTFSFIGSTELVELHRKVPNYTLELPIVNSLSKGERYIVLSRLSDYFSFIKDDDGKLRRYLFESNVRDFMGLNRVNEDIKNTLESLETPDFWWLNNGVTILATSAAITGDSVKISDIQIVNGLQTTESIYRYFRDRPEQTDDRCILVKVIVSKEETVRDRIIRATNNQTAVELSSLNATDKIQRDIEDILLQHDLYYERRNRFYANQGYDASLIVTPLYAASAYVALVSKAPYRAATLRSKFMRYKEPYNRVFNDKLPLGIWPIIIKTFKNVDRELEKIRPQKQLTENFLKSWRSITAFLIIAKHFKTFHYSIKDIGNFPPSAVNAETVNEVWNCIYVDNTKPPRKMWGSLSKVRIAAKRFSQLYEINGLDFFDHQIDLHLNPNAEIPERRNRTPSDEFLQTVLKQLPPQPWETGMHKKLCKALSCKPWKLADAIDRLVEEGKIYKQVDGQLFNLDGELVLVEE